MQMNSRRLTVVALTLLASAGAAVWLARSDAGKVNVTLPAPAAPLATSRSTANPQPSISKAPDPNIAHRTAIQSNTQSPPAHKLDVDRTPFLSQYPTLVNQANHGDAAAAAELYDNLQYCAGTPHSQAALDDSKKDAEVNYGKDSDRYSNAVTFLNRRYEFCSKLTLDQINDYKKWLALAAQLGDHQARLEYVQHGQPNNPNSDTPVQDARNFNATATQYLNDELASGNPEALFIASLNYQGNGGIFEPDQVKAYSYLYAYLLAQDITQGVLFNRLQQLGTTLSPNDLTTANSQGEAIYKQCCIR